MSDNVILKDPKQVQITAPTGGLSAGEPYFDGVWFGVCENDIAEAEVGYMTVAADVRTLVFAGGTTPAKNAPAYWDPTQKKIYGAWASGRVRCGSFYAAAATDDTTCRVMVAGCPVYATEEGDITDVTAGTGLTGGGTAGAVTLACDFGTASGKVCEGNDSRLSDARTPTAHVSTHEDGGDDELALESMAYTNAVLVGVGDPAAALDAIVDVLRTLPQVKRITVALGATSGASAGDVTMIGGRVTGIVPVSGNDQAVAGYSIHGTTGAVTLTLAAASTAEAVFDVWIQPLLPA